MEASRIYIHVTWESTCSIIIFFMLQLAYCCTEAFKPQKFLALKHYKKSKSINLKCL